MRKYGDRLGIWDGWEVAIFKYCLLFDSFILKQFFFFQFMYSFLQFIDTLWMYSCLVFIYITSLMAFLNTDAVSPFDKTADS